MFAENDLSSNNVDRGENAKNQENPDVKPTFPEKSTEFLRKSDSIRDGYRLKPSKPGNLGSQELTLSYLCENSSKMDSQEKEGLGKNFLGSLEKIRSEKGKEVVPDCSKEEEKWVERDFLQLNGISATASALKRDKEEDEEIEKEKKEKKLKMETLNLSLSLPDVSLSLTSTNPLRKSDPVTTNPSSAVVTLATVPKSSKSNQSLVPSNNITRTGSSDDFPAPSLSYSYSHPFSHNPSCSLTRNSTENYDYSVGSHRRENDQIWYCGEGTNGSVHSRFKPVADGVSLSNHVGFGSQLNWAVNKDSSNSLYRAAGSENNSFFPSELPARPMQDNHSTGSRGRGSDRQRGFENNSNGGGRARKLTRPERLLREVVLESIPVMAQIFQELPDETIESTKEYLKNLIGAPEKTDELIKLQSWVEGRSDLTFELLSKCNKVQLDILVTIKTGLLSYLPGKNNLSIPELAEIFLLLRCKNVNCKSILPIDDCDCNICSTKKGFCSACMCPVCLNFDCANNTCSWVGCDLCSHWCHAVCGIQKDLIKPGRSLGGATGTKEMHFYCLGCGHASEMFGFVKDVFMCCAKDWGLETLIKELDCVRKIFKGSEDSKGKELHCKAEEMLLKLEHKSISPSDACNYILQFLKYGKSDFPVPGNSSKDAPMTQINQMVNKVSGPPATSVPPKTIAYNTGSSFARHEDARQNNLKALMADRTVEEELQYNLLAKSGFDSLESIIRIKEAEARMFQSKADEALHEAEGYRRLARARSEKLEEEYTSKLAKLCLQETEERRRKKLEELKALESSHFDYYNMKIRMQAEIAGLLERMEATKQQWV